MVDSHLLVQSSKYEELLHLSLCLLSWQRLHLNRDNAQSEAIEDFIVRYIEDDATIHDTYMHTLLLTFSTGFQIIQ